MLQHARRGEEMVFRGRDAWRLAFCVPACEIKCRVARHLSWCRHGIVARNLLFKRAYIRRRNVGSSSAATSGAVRRSASSSGILHQHHRDRRQ